MLRSLVAATTMPLIFAACAGGNPTHPQDAAATLPPPLHIEFLGARAHKPRSFGYIDPTESLMQHIVPGRALFIDKATSRRFQFNCAMLGKIMNEGLIDMNLSKDSKERRALKANVDQIMAGYLSLGCGRHLEA